MVEQVFLPFEEVWLIHSADEQSTLEGREEASGQRKSFLFKFFSSCLKMWNFMSSDGYLEIFVRGAEFNVKVKVE